MPAPRPGWVILFVFAILAVFGGMVGYAYNWGVSQFETPVILADSGPIKRNGNYKHGLYTKEAIEERRALSALLRASRKSLDALSGQD